MHDRLSIWHNDKTCLGSRHLWENDAGAVFQTVFYHHRARPDPTAYGRFAADDASMNGEFTKGEG